VKVDYAGGTIVGSEDKIGLYELQVHDTRALVAI
jgi:hypothetical protein